MTPTPWKIAQGMYTACNTTIVVFTFSLNSILRFSSQLLVRITVEPRFNEVAGDRPNLFVKWRVCYIEVLFHTFYCNFGRDIEIISFVISRTSSNRGSLNRGSTVTCVFFAKRALPWFFPGSFLCFPRLMPSIWHNIHAAPIPSHENTPLFLFVFAFLLAAFR